MKNLGFWLNRNCRHQALPLDRQALPVDMEPLLRAAAQWEAEVLPPPDFAAFTRRALRQGKRGSRYQNGIGWVGALRSPLVLGLASVCVLWVGGSHAPHEKAKAAAVAVAPTPRFAHGAPQATPQAQTPAFAAVSEAAASEPPLLPRITKRRVVAAAPLLHVRHNRHFHLVARTVKQASPVSRSFAALWKTETVERPAWGALVPVPYAAECNAAATAVAEASAAACDLPCADDAASGGKPAEAQAMPALMPVVVDVSLPNVETVCVCLPTPTPAP